MSAAGDGWLGRTLRPRKAPTPRAAVATVYRTIASVPDEDAEHAWKVVPPVVADAYDVPAGHRLAVPDPDSESVWLTGMLNAAQPLLEADPRRCADLGGHTAG
ncbi:hypothetical protein GCM10017673_02420 [Streptosporangium violaceochromogenes]|nr:hypothetical protein GCM10017673_02420 [Streptosporangium violaceochromogenes]